MFEDMGNVDDVVSQLLTGVIVTAVHVRWDVHKSD
jgi:hypothetical protein